MAPLRRLIDEFLTPEANEVSGNGELQRLLAGVSRLVDVTSTLAAEIESRDIDETVAREACRALRCEHAVLLRFDSLHDELYATYSTVPLTQEIRRATSEGLSGHAALHRQVVMASDPGNDPRCLPDLDFFGASETFSLMAGPLLAPQDGSLLGVLLLGNREGQSFDAVDEELFTAFGQHAAVALDRARLLEQLRQRQTVQASLDVAREIQRGFMPDELPQVPGYEAATWWFPNEAVGGDYCDLIRMKDNSLAIVIADVSGHGLGPSLIMASLRAALLAMLIEHSTPEVLLSLLGRSLYRDLPEGRFITMVLAVLKPKDHSLEYANAGHAPALHFEAATGEFYPLESTGMPLGVQSHPEYPQGWPIELQVGDILILCTDGIIEVMDRYDKQFGQHRLEEIIRSHAERPVSEIVKVIGQEVEAHFPGSHPPDDLTVLAIRRNR